MIETGWLQNDWMLLGAIIVAVKLVIVLIFFRKYLVKLWYDWVFDLAISSIDEFLGSLAYRVDWADLFIAAPIIYIKTRQFANRKVALFAAWEASGFFPVNVIPVMGDGVDWFANFLPMVFIIRILPFLNDFVVVKRLVSNLKRAREMIKERQWGIPLDKELFDAVKELVKQERAEEAIEKVREAERSIYPMMRDHLIEEEWKPVQQEAETLAQAPVLEALPAEVLDDFPEELVARMEQEAAAQKRAAVSSAQALLNRAQLLFRKKELEMGDFDAALGAIDQAKGVLQKTVVTLNQELENLHHQWIALQDSEDEYEEGGAEEDDEYEIAA